MKDFLNLGLRFVSLCRCPNELKMLVLANISSGIIASDKKLSTDEVSDKAVAVACKLCEKVNLIPDFTSEP